MQSIHRYKESNVREMEIFVPPKTKNKKKKNKPLYIKTSGPMYNVKNLQKVVRIRGLRGKECSAEKMHAREWIYVYVHGAGTAGGKKIRVAGKKGWRRGWLARQTGENKQTNERTNTHTHTHLNVAYYSSHVYKKRKNKI